MGVEGRVRLGKREQREECDSVIMSKTSHFKERQGPAEPAEREATEMSMEVHGSSCLYLKCHSFVHHGCLAFILSFEKHCIELLS